MRSTIWTTRGVDLVLLGPGIVDGSDGGFLKSYASEEGPEGLSRKLNVLIVEDGCILLGVALAKHLLSDELEYKIFFFPILFVGYVLERLPLIFVRM